MTTDKARKRAVRTRMQKTGERYAAARRHVVADPRPEAGLAAAATPTEPAGSVAPPEPALPTRPVDLGVGDAALERGTGHGWDHWLGLLDEWGAMDRSHRDIARHLTDVHGLSGWWAQSVTVGYERARGRRAVHETTRGFEVSVSRTIRATAPEVWAIIADDARRDGWLGAGFVTPATSRPGKWSRFAVPGRTSTVTVHLDPTPDDRVRVTVVHARLADGEDVARQRVAWREHLARLAAALEARARVAPDRGQAS